MNTPTSSPALKPPRTIPTILAGFNTVANRIWLILLPVGLDLLLWFAPKLSVKNLMMNSLNESLKMLTQLGSADLVNSLQGSTKIWEETLGQFSLLYALRTIPVGVPSIIVRMLNPNNPIGTPGIVEVQSSGQAFLISVALILIGFFLGSLYFNLLSRYTSPAPEKLKMDQLARQFLQSVGMALFLLLLGFFILIPVTFLLSLFSIFGSGVSQFLMLLAVFVLIWMLIPLVFSPHGVFVMQQKAMPSMMMSSRMVRFFLPGTGSFVMVCVLINEGMNFLWTSTPSNSWLTLIGILAHAFVVTSLLTSTFIYYREGYAWMQENLQHMNAAVSKRSQNGGFFGRNQ